jgi:hypothetical protein
MGDSSDFATEKFAAAKKPDEALAMLKCQSNVSDSRA